MSGGIRLPAGTGGLSEIQLGLRREHRLFWVRTDYNAVLRLKTTIICKWNKDLLTIAVIFVLHRGFYSPPQTLLKCIAVCFRASFYIYLYAWTHTGILYFLFKSAGVGLPPRVLQ